MEAKTRRLRVDHREGIGIVKPEGHLTLGDGDRDLLDLVGDLLTSGRHHLVVDLADVDYLDAAGLGMLLRCQRRVAAHGGRLILTGAFSAKSAMAREASTPRTRRSTRWPWTGRRISVAGVTPVTHRTACWSVADTFVTTSNTTRWFTRRTQRSVVTVVTTRTRRLSMTTSRWGTA